MNDAVVLKPDLIDIVVIVILVFLSSLKTDVALGTARSVLDLQSHGPGLDYRRRRWAPIGLLRYLIT